MLARSLAAGLALGLVSPAALAANTAVTGPREPTPAHPAPYAQQLSDRCAALLSAFDQNIDTHTTAPKATDARALRTTAATQCKANDTTTGLKSIEQALPDIGVNASL